MSNEEKYVGQFKVNIDLLKIIEEMTEEKQNELVDWIIEKNNARNLKGSIKPASNGAITCSNVPLASSITVKRDVPSSYSFGNEKIISNFNGINEVIIENGMITAKFFDKKEN